MEVYLRVTIGPTTRGYTPVVEEEPYLVDGMPEALFRYDPYDGSSSLVDASTVADEIMGTMEVWASKESLWRITAVTPVNEHGKEV